MKKIIFLYWILFLSINVFAQEIIKVQPNITRQNNSVSGRILGYKTHFYQTDSSLIILSNGQDSIKFWNQKNYYSDDFLDFYISNVHYANTGFYNLTIYNTIDDTVYLENAINVLPYSNSIASVFDIYKKDYIAGDSTYTYVIGHNTHFQTGLNAKAYLINNQNDTINFDSLNPISEDSLVINFNVPLDKVGYYSYYYTNDIDSVIASNIAIRIINSNMTQIDSVSPDSVSNTGSFGSKISIYGNRTHFTNDTNFIYIGVMDFDNVVQNVLVVNDSLIEFDLYLPVPVKSPVFPNSIIEVYNPTDGLLLYPIRIDMYGGIGDDKSVFSNLQIYPNPTSDVINIHSDDLFQEKPEITIYSIDGKLIKKYISQNMNNFSIDVSKLTSGLYLIKVESNNRLGVLKFIKK